MFWTKIWWKEKHISRKSKFYVYFIQLIGTAESVDSKCTAIVGRIIHKQLFTSLFQSQNRHFLRKPMICFVCKNQKNAFLWFYETKTKPINSLQLSFGNRRILYSFLIKHMKTIMLFDMISINSTTKLMNWFFLWRRRNQKGKNVNIFCFN